MRRNDCWRRRLAQLGVAGALVFAAAASPAEQLTFFDSFEWSADPEAHGVAVVLSPDGRNLYVARRESYYISIFSRDPSTGEFNYVADAPNSFAGPICITVDGVIISCNTTYSGQDQAIRLTADGRFLYASLNGDPGIIIYERDLNTGLLTQGANLIISGGGPRLELSPDQSELYAATRSAIFRLERDPITGGLTMAQTFGAEGFGRIAGVATSPDGQNVYVSNDYGLDPTDGKVAVFRRNSESGDFELSEVIDDGIDIPNRVSSPAGIVISPDGAFAYLAVPIYAQDTHVSGVVVVFSRDTATGNLTPLDTITSADSLVDPIAIPLSPVLNADGTKLLVVGKYGLVLFDRDVNTGRLTQLATDDHLCTFLSDFSGAAISSDTADFYVNAAGGAGQGTAQHLIWYRYDSFECAAQPRDDCAVLASVSSSITIRNDENDNFDKISWNWRGIDLSGEDDLVHRRGGFAVCIYADAGLGPQFAHEAYAPGGDCWYDAPNGNGLSFSIARSTAPMTQNGARVTTARIKSRNTRNGSKQKIRIAAKRLDAAAPELPLPAMGSTRVQLVRYDDHCWEAEFAPEQMSTNSTLEFRAKSKAP